MKKNDKRPHTKGDSRGKPRTAPESVRTTRPEELPLSHRESGERINMKPGALTAPLPPVIVTVGDGEVANMITIGWTGILATHPPKTYISVRPQRHSYGIIKRTGEFVINLTTTGMAKAVDYAGIYTGAKVDKFAKTGLTPIPSKEVTAPTLAEAPLALECRVSEVMSMGTHDVFVADIVNVSVSPNMLDGEGKLRYDKAELLAYAHGEYYALGQKLGAFGFSTDKGKKTPPVSGKKRNNTAKNAPKSDSDTALSHKEANK